MKAATMKRINVSSSALLIQEAGVWERAHSLLARHAAVTVDPLLPPQPTSMTLHD